MRLFLAIVAGILLTAQSAAGQSELVLELRVNQSSQTVHVPGLGDADASDLGERTSYSSPESLFIASFLGNSLMGLAAQAGSGLVTEGGDGWHSIGISSDMGEPAYLAFTRGGWEDIQKRMPDIEGGEFLDYVSPAFGFGLGKYHPLEVTLRYSGIDLEGALGMSRGIFKLVIENKGQSGGRPLVEVRAS